MDNTRGFLPLSHSLTIVRESAHKAQILYRGQDMAKISTFPFLDGNDLRVVVGKSVYGQTRLEFTAGADEVTFYVSVADIERVFGTLNNYLASLEVKA